MSDPFETVHSRLRELPAFFIGGMPRSGTTWMQQLLNTHPEVLCLGESHFMADLAPDLYKKVKEYGERREAKARTWGPTVRPPSPEQIWPFLRSAFAMVAAANLDGKDLDRLVTVGEKTPENLAAMEFLWKIFPSSRIIHVIRDPRDGALSGFVRFSAAIPEDCSRADYIELYCGQWSERILKARKSGAGRADYLEIRYEDMHAATAEKAAELFAFLGVSTAPGIVGGAVEAASFESLSGGRRQGEEDPASHYRKGTVGGWRDVLTTEEAGIAERVAGPLLAELGYL